MAARGALRIRVERPRRRRRACCGSGSRCGATTAAASSSARAAPRGRLPADARAARDRAEARARRPTRVPDGFSSVGRDGVRKTALRTAPRAAERGRGARLRPRPAARAAAWTSVDFEVSEAGTASRRDPARAIRGRLARDLRRSALQPILRRSLDDLELLHSSLDGHSYYAAGVPWFATLFGRDSLLTASRRSPSSGVAEARCGRWRPARPSGRRARRGARQGAPRAARGRAGDTRRRRSRATTEALTPRRCSCASSASTPTGPATSTFRELRRAGVEAALEWIDRYGDLDGDGLVRSTGTLAGGLATQGLEGLGGRRPRPRRRAARAAGRARGGAGLRDPREAARWRACSSWTATARAASGCEPRPPASGGSARTSGSRTLAVTRSARRREAPGLWGDPNQGHLLWADGHRGAGAASATCLMGDDMFTGWGVRTLAESHPASTPVGYHRSCGRTTARWCVRAAPRVRRGFTLILRGLLEAASRFGDYRLPELFAGFPRAEFDEPVPYPVACQPQAWAAGSIPYLLRGASA